MRELQTQLPSPESVLKIDLASSTPLHAQLHEALAGLIRNRLSDGDRFYNETELAARLHISLGTVRRALSDLTAEGMLERLRAKGTYVRKRNLDFTVGAFMSSRLSMNSRFFRCLCGACAQRGFRLRSYPLNDDTRVDDALRQIEQPPQNEALILLDDKSVRTFDLFAALEKRGFRTVNVGPLLPSYTGSCVGVDNEEGARLGIEHLDALGHRNILFWVTEPFDDENAQARINGFKRMAAWHGLQEYHVAVCPVPPSGKLPLESFYETFDAALRQWPKTTAIFAASDNAAWIAMKRLISKGVTIPEQFSVLGFDDDTASALMHPALTTISQPCEAIAQAALGLLLEEDLGPRQRMLSPSLVIRESTAPPAE